MLPSTKLFGKISTWLLRRSGGIICLTFPFCEATFGETLEDRMKNVDVFGVTSIPDQRTELQGHFIWCRWSNNPRELDTLNTRACVCLLRLYPAQRTRWHSYYLEACVWFCFQSRTVLSAACPLMESCCNCSLWWCSSSWYTNRSALYIPHMSVSLYNNVSCLKCLYVMALSVLNKSSTNTIQIR